uniref:Uncharacterized protein AlNc14C82G5347 n=1 Tax=Albugo laibachii Nc14 TaxID=890382 RepID=F0WFF8_9STRA|nr:conserved hypothetical protein [Albugo laibachii Nc14]|eukprot:CCA19940.1 conserved hypothetical protein [Albugo laibachii Nc14]
MYDKRRSPRLGHAVVIPIEDVAKYTIGAKSSQIKKLSEKILNTNLSSIAVMARDSVCMDNHTTNDAGSLPSRCLLVMLAPNGKSAMSFLLFQPPGTFMLAFVDNTLCIYFKLLWVVQKIVIACADTATSIIESTEWNFHWNANSSTKTEYLHRVYVPNWMFEFLKKCWKQSLPSIRTIYMTAFAELTQIHECVLCDLSQKYFWECEQDTVEWHKILFEPEVIDALTAQSEKYALMLNSKALGFYLLCSEVTKGEETGSCPRQSVSYRVRNIEFNLESSVLAITDGVATIESSRTTLRFGRKKSMAIKGVLFTSLKDSFLNPHQTILKFVTAPVESGQLLDKQRTSLSLAQSAQNSAESKELQALMRLHEELHMYPPSIQHSEKLAEAMKQFLGSVSISKKPPNCPDRECDMAEEVIIHLMEKLISDHLKQVKIPDLHCRIASGSAIAHLVNKCIVAMSSRYATKSNWMQILHCLFRMMSQRKGISADFVDVLHRLSISSQFFQEKLMAFSGLRILWDVYTSSTSDPVLPTAGSTENINQLAEISFKCIPQPSSRIGQIVSIVAKKLWKYKRHTHNESGLKYSLDQVFDIDIPLFTQLNPLLLRYELEDSIASRPLDAFEHHVPCEAVQLETAILSFIYRVVTDLLISTDKTSYFWRSKCEQCLGLNELYGKLFSRIRFHASSSEMKQTELIFPTLVALMELQKQLQGLFGEGARCCEGFQDCLQYFKREWDLFFASWEICKSIDTKYSSLIGLKSIKTMFSLQFYIVETFPLELLEAYVSLTFEKICACTIQFCSLHKLYSCKPSLEEGRSLADTFAIGLVYFTKLYTCIINRLRIYKPCHQVIHQLLGVDATIPIQYMTETILSVPSCVQQQGKSSTDIFCDFLEALLRMVRNCDVSSALWMGVVDLFCNTCMRGNLCISASIGDSKGDTSDDTIGPSRSALRLLVALYCTFDHGEWRLTTTPLQNVKWHMDRLMCSAAVECCRLHFLGVLAILERRLVYFNDTNDSEITRYVTNNLLVYFLVQAGGRREQLERTMIPTEEHSKFTKSFCIPSILWPQSTQNLPSNGPSLSKTTAFVLILLLSSILAPNRPGALPGDDSSFHLDVNTIDPTADGRSPSYPSCPYVDLILSHLLKIYQSFKDYRLPELLILVLDDKELSEVWLLDQKSKAMRMLLHLMVPDFYPRNLYIPDNLYEKSSNLDTASRPQSSRRSSDEDIDAFESFLNANGSRRDTQEPQKWMYVAKGSFASVYSSYIPRLNTRVAVKRIPCQRSRQNRSVIPDVFHEIQVLDKLNQNAKGASLQLLDYGLCTNDEHFEIITEFCPYNLKEWRDSVKSPIPIGSILRLILFIFSTLCRHLELIHSAGILHSDIKCENILIRCEDCHAFTNAILQSFETGEDNWREYLDRMVVFADFGEALPLVRALEGDGNRFCEYVGRARGTEAIQSPEMLQHSSDSTLRITSASDIWSMGALLYELLGERMLFEQETSASLYAHLVLHKKEMSSSSGEFHTLKPQHIAYLEEYYSTCQPMAMHEKELLGDVIRLCDYTLQRDPLLRPALSDIQHSVSRLLATNLNNTCISTQGKALKNDFAEDGKTTNDSNLDDYSYHGMHSDSDMFPDVLAVRENWGIHLPFKDGSVCCSNWHDQVTRVMLQYEGMYDHFIFVMWGASTTDSGRENLSKVFSTRDYSLWYLDNVDRNSTNERMEAVYITQFAISQIASEFYIFLASMAHCSVLITTYVIEECSYKRQERERFLSMVLRTLLFAHQDNSQRPNSVLETISHWGKVNTAARLSYILPTGSIIKDLHENKRKLESISKV